MKYGLFFGPSRHIENNQEYRYAPRIDGTDFTNEEGRDAVTEDSEDISDYTLTEFKAGETNSISKLRYFTNFRLSSHGFNRGMKGGFYLHSMQT